MRDDRAIPKNRLGQMRRTKCLKPILVLIILYSSTFGQSDPFIAAIEHVKLSVVPVACSTWPDAKNTVQIKEIEGTGFFVNYEGSFVTAGHVIRDRFKWDKRGRPDPACFPVIYIPNPTWRSIRWFVFQQCVVDDSMDIAACKTQINPFAEGLHISRLHLIADRPPDGTRIAFTGFPQLITVPVTSRGNVASFGEFLGGEDILIDKTTWHGVSGGPLYTSDGSVIGIMHRMGETLWEGMAFARPTNTVLKFLSNNRISVWQEEQQPKKKNKK